MCGQPNVPSVREVIFLEAALRFVGKGALKQALLDPGVDVPAVVQVDRS